MKKIQEKAKAVLEKTQEEIKKYINRKRVEVDEYRVEDLVMLSTKDLKYQMVRKRAEKLTERFIEPYRIKKIVSSNVVELELPSIVKIYSVVNVSKICKYIECQGQISWPESEGEETEVQESTEKRKQREQRSGGAEDEGKEEDAMEGVEEESGGLSPVAYSVGTVAK